MSLLPPELRNTILVGDARHQLATVPTASVDCVITSPPYFGLRDYGQASQLGLEYSVDEWVRGLRAVCREVARVLKPTGSFWLNIGDGFSAHPREGAPVKSLLLGPQRLAIGLVEDDWAIRNQVIWAKTNAMPSSVGDRLSCTYEIVLLLVRSRRYFFDLDAIRTPLASPAEKPRRTVGTTQYPPPEAAPIRDGVDANRGLRRLKLTGRVGHPLGRNPGDVWRLSTAGFRGGHFAVFPPALVERPLLATCPQRVCTSCEQPWRRGAAQKHGEVTVLGALRPSRTCAAETVPGVVLDPFLGSGTVAVVAERHGRHWLGVELNPDYARMALERVAEARRRPT
ncbi:MAG: DNA-methyltransferase [Mycobacteriales bacterium]